MNRIRMDVLELHLKKAALLMAFQYSYSTAGRMPLYAGAWIPDKSGKDDAAKKNKIGTASPLQSDTSVRWLRPHALMRGNFGSLPVLQAA
jgi:hypothetical protein